MNAHNLEVYTREGHRKRLRKKFFSDSTSISEVELLELLLTYALPRKDVAPLAKALLRKYGTLKSILSAPQEELTQIKGIGKSVATFLGVIRVVFHTQNTGQEGNMDSSGKDHQLNLFSVNLDEKAAEKNRKQVQTSKKKAMRVFANDEIQNALTFIPKAAGFNHLDGFQNYLAASLPYNSQATRERRARIIIERFFTHTQIQTPLVYFASHCSSTIDLQSAIFFHTLKAEPALTKIAEELIWPALPVGRVNREKVRDFMLGFLPAMSLSSQKNMLRSIFNTYSLCSVGKIVRNTLRFNLRPGTFESFLYVFTSEFSHPGIFSFESLYQGPLHYWLLWDREWLRRQLYNLRDLNIITKIAEIDAVKQFTLDLDQMAALTLYFENPENKLLIVREASQERPDLGEDTA